ncbi:DUF1697 domain-containing protein [Winogradskyella thalassocola]|uniref:Uncharacterized conserved protein, DUF1697 family n=1 Tax=Winogradskyella thalassocola TaxID=262004 RepID=A0A1G7YDM5_9FLAO|nr:DUF1697 domain-containing protein [Winogradskyella thalassocola]SDG94668.1 Uncharacterized conserved protein, DUF1697 family [Winogradskyella thalassocola]
MQTYIALLRGINVGGHKKVPMAELRELLVKSGLINVKTYIQSGNVIFKSSIRDSKDLETNIQKLILKQFGFEVPVLVKTREELSLIYNNCPFTDDKKAESYYVMLSEIPRQILVEEATQKTYPDDEYIILNDCIYLYCTKGYGQSKFNLNFFERKLNVNATARNYKTMVKLLSLSDI